MVQTIETEYLLRPLIEGAAYAIDDSHVRITSPSTLYIDAHRIIPSNKDELLSLYKRILSKAKAQEIKISYTQHIRKQITERWAEYESRCAEANMLFSSIIEQAKIIQARGLHYGTRDDTELDKLGALRSEYEKYFWRNSIISRILGIYGELMDMESNLSSSLRQMSKIYL